MFSFWGWNDNGVETPRKRREDERGIIHGSNGSAAVRGPLGFGMGRGGRSDCNGHRVDGDSWSVRGGRGDFEMNTGPLSTRIREVLGRPRDVASQLDVGATTGFFMLPCAPGSWVANIMSIFPPVSRYPSVCFFVRPVGAFFGKARPLCDGFEAVEGFLLYQSLAAPSLVVQDWRLNVLPKMRSQNALSKCGSENSIDGSNPT